MSEKKPSLEEILAHFNDQGVSDYIVLYARLMTSCHLVEHADQFTPYLQGQAQTIPQFVAAEVEPMGKDSDYLQCVAFANEVGIGVRIEYLGKTFRIPIPFPIPFPFSISN